MSIRDTLSRGSSRFALALSILGLLLAGDGLRGQQKPDVTVQVKVVNVPATVRDKHGAIVNNLTKDDFILEEDGRPQTEGACGTGKRGILQRLLVIGLAPSTEEAQRKN